VSCKQATQEESSPEEKTETVDTDHSGHDHDHAFDANDDRGDSPWTFLTRGYFYKNIELDGGEIINDAEDRSETIKFYDDNKYVKKRDNKIIEEGVWKYTIDTDVLHLNNRSPEGSNSEYTIKHGNDNLIFVGTSTYGNNATQIKYTRITQ